MDSDTESNSSTIEEYFDAKSELSDSSSTIVGDHMYEDAEEELYWQTQDQEDVHGEEVYVHMEMDVGAHVEVDLVEQQDVDVLGTAGENELSQLQFCSVECKHHMSFDENLMLRDVIRDEWAFRKWFHFGEKKMTMGQLKRHFATHKVQMEECMQEITVNIHERSICAWYARYDEIVTRFYHKLLLIAVIPYGNVSVDIILRQGEKGRYLHLKLQGVQHHFAVDLAEIREEYLLNPHPRSLRNIKCPFRPLCFAKFEPTNSVFVLCQMGGQAILITLYPSDNFFYQYHPCG